MSHTNVLYDEPGPRARRQAAIGGTIATVALLVLVALVVKRLAEQGQFSGKLWGPLLNPSDPDFNAVWTLIGKGVLATLTAAVLAIAFSLIVGVVVGVARMMLGRRSRMPIVGLIELLRGLPVVITIYFASRVLPELGVNLSGLPGEDGLWYLVIGLTAYNSVVIAEII
ncbi:MAG: ABC transporter permease subunit, partial [Dermatophilaceae bacterium]